VEVRATDEVTAAATRLADAGLGAACCTDRQEASDAPPTAAGCACGG
jgi:hypothetical protein